MGKQMLPINAKRTRPRKSRDRRLLEALLDELSIHIYSDGQGGFMFTEKRCAGHLKPSEAKQLIAIKQAMEKKGKSQ
jgi:hypothetical protein